MKTSKNKLIAVLAAVASLSAASNAMAGGNNGSGGGARANPPTQGQSQKPQSQQSPSKHLESQQTNQNSQSQKWTTGSCGQYRIFRIDGNGAAINTKAIGDFNASQATFNNLKGNGAAINTKAIGNVNASQTTSTNPSGNGANTTTVFGGTVTQGQPPNSGGTETGGTGTGMPPRPYPRGGSPVSNGATYTAYRVDAAAEPALPANAAPPVVVRIMNPAATTNLPIGFMINGQVVRLQAGEAGDFRVDGSGLVKFHRGGNFGESSYTLKQGEYRFEATAQGWELYEEGAAATQTGGLPRNALPGEGSK